MALDPTELAISHSRRLELAYLKVFGPLDTRDADQRLVWADLEKHCKVNALSAEARTDGEIAHLKTYFNEGRRSVYLHIRGNILKAGIEPRLLKIRRGKPTT